jgi:hypothetical protein
MIRLLPRFLALFLGACFLVIPQGMAQEPDFQDFPADDPFGDIDPEVFGQPGGPQELPPEVIAGMVIGGIVGLVIGLGIMILLILALTSCFKRIPQQYRLMEPGMVWLLLIPCFPLIWNFFVYPRLSKSFQNYFNAQGRTDVGDCGQQIGLWYSICAAVSIIPLVNYCAGPVALVLLIIYIVKALGLKGQIPEGATA